MQHFGVSVFPLFSVLVSENSLSPCATVSVLDARWQIGDVVAGLPLLNRSTAQYQMNKRRRVEVRGQRSEVRGQRSEISFAVGYQLLVIGLFVRHD